MNEQRTFLWPTVGCHDKNKTAGPEPDDVDLQILWLLRDAVNSKNEARPALNAAQVVESLSVSAVYLSIIRTPKHVKTTESYRKLRFLFD